MKKFIISIAMAALAAPMFAQTAAPQRVAVVDVQKVLTQSAPGKAAYDKLKKMQEERIERAKSMDADIKKLGDDITAKRVSLSEDKLAEMNKQLTEKQTAMRRYAEDADREIAEARDRELLALQNKIEPVINGIGKEMGLAVIFNKFESGLIYAADAIDITEVVVKRFNEAVGTQPAAAPAKK